MAIVRGFQWDARKNDLNLLKHGIDFDEAIEVFYAPHLLRPADHPTEERWLAVGDVDSRTITVIFTWRDGDIRVISARRARKDEKRTYRQKILGRPPEG